MCRKCGEPDRRGSAKARRRSRQRLLDTYGNGTIAGCVWCERLVANRRGYLDIAGRRIIVERMERDRLEIGGPYAFWNLVPSCGPCNRARTYQRQLVEPGCWFGSGQPLAPAEIDVAA